MANSAAGLRLIEDVLSDESGHCHGGQLCALEPSGLDFWGVLMTAWGTTLLLVGMPLAVGLQGFPVHSNAGDVKGTL